MANPRIDIDAFLNDTEVSRAANRIQVDMDRISTISEKTGLSTTAINKALSQSVKQNTMSITDFRSAYQVAMDVVRVGEQVWGATVEKAQEYDQSIRDIMLSTGATAEESSRLVQVVDDVGVSYGTLKTALKMASKDGIEPNIDSIKKLSDEYLKLSPGVERNQFLLDKFGKSGLEMARVMELGGSAIGKMNDEISGGLVLTQEAIDQSEEYRKNVDELKDSWDALVVTWGNKVIPLANDVMEGMRNQNEIRERANDLLKEGIAGNREEALSLAASLVSIEQYTQGLDSAGVSYRAMAKALGEEVTPAMEDNTVSVEDATKANSEYLSTIGDLSDEYKDHGEKLQGIKDDQVKLLEEKQKLLSQGYWPESDAIQNINEKINENQDKYDEATIEFEDNTHRRMLAMLEEQLSIDGLSEKESTFLLEQGIKWGIYSADAVEAMAAIQRQVDAMERNIDININVHTNYSAEGQAALTNQLAGEKGYTPTSTNGHATGGTFMIPQSYGNEGFMLGGGDTASGGEKLKVIPQGKNDGGLDTDRIIAAIMSIKTDEKTLSRLIVEGTLEKIR